MVFNHPQTHSSDLLSMHVQYESHTLSIPAATSSSLVCVVLLLHLGLMGLIWSRHIPKHCGHGADLLFCNSLYFCFLFFFQNFLCTYAIWAAERAVTTTAVVVASHFRGGIIY